jgi:hypothetical protein
MSLDKVAQIDAAGIDRNSGSVVLTIADYWDWAHLLALQAKLNAYFRFIESGQILKSYPEAHGRTVTIDIVGKHALPLSAEQFLLKATEAAKQLNVTISSRHIPGGHE